MKSILLTIICFIFTPTISSKQSNEIHAANLLNDKSAVYEGTITGIKIFYGMSTNGLSSTGMYSLNLDTYPEMDFEFTLKDGLKWGLIKELTPGLAFVNSEECKGWNVKLTVNNNMRVTKCKILSYGDESE